MNNIKEYMHPADTKLHLGCGKCYIPGWTNLDIDIFNNASIDVVDNAKTLKTIKDASCDLIYASHILEHFGRAEYMDVLHVWFRKLRKGGRLRLSVPDFDSIVQVYNENANIEILLGLLTGGQRTIHDYHNMIFNKESLTSALLKIGFLRLLISISPCNFFIISHFKASKFKLIRTPFSLSICGK